MCVRAHSFVGVPHSCLGISQKPQYCKRLGRVLAHYQMAPCRSEPGGSAACRECKTGAHLIRLHAGECLRPPGACVVWGCDAEKMRRQTAPASAPVPGGENGTALSGPAISSAPVAAGAAAGAAAAAAADRALRYKAYNSLRAEILHCQGCPHGAAGGGPACPMSANCFKYKALLVHIAAGCNVRGCGCACGLPCGRCWGASVRGSRFVCACVA